MGKGVILSAGGQNVTQKERRIFVDKKKKQFLLACAISPLKGIISSEEYLN